MTDVSQYGLTYEEWFTVAKFLNPNLSQSDYDEKWREFCVEKERAEQLKAQGIAIHPTYGHKL